MTKIVKKGQLQMPVESRKPVIHSGFFRLKHTYIIGEQKKLHMEGFCRGLSSQKIPKIPWQIGQKSQNHIEKLVSIILGRFSINKTLK
jgi:hypothetical protein